MLVVDIVIEVVWVDTLVVVCPVASVLFIIASSEVVRGQLKKNNKVVDEASGNGG